ncbi:Hint domain-containing protein [Bradyrhizobium sp. ISRA443]|uniref:Hint domain-containing protein n=1 Tax=unclassified Bradyrhizobium TaxID=2631580 RepID=UPI00247B0259|nr:MULTISPECIES: Hint domain-containing protein [unclassified Bradyrhizobium]WGR94494.1 Hint domain-containing protein [Bradyrhizobium sp. ISRA435]WGR99239.1 Hint domain-containing protein [Bradyrhizobium sp. ISRA436]WGS06131.1 Hint domain-containing protein [Bradyrhizobium sp. ISRA437]WGS13016.1 Hint domain-containing protein [Bradyrhizobium sp. ISRA443]
MRASNNQHTLNPARRHFVRASVAFAGKLAGIAALASIALPPSSQATPGNGGGYGGGHGGGRGHCFLKGTRVLTSRGEAQIEDLGIGDLVKTMRGEDLPIKWIGRHTFRRNGASWSKRVMPIRVSRFAIDDKTPHTDLYLSPLHALFIDGFLMPVRDLVNETSIAPALPPDMETIEYFQIVLNTHEVIWAEGAPTETFGGNGLELFDNFSEYKRLYPNDPCSTIPLVAPNLGTGPAHLRALLGVGASYFIDVRDPLQEAYEQFAARAEELAA